MKKYETPIRLLVILAAILGISLLHYITPLKESVLHDIFQRLYYIPIILAAFWFGLKGGIGTALIVSILYAPHIILQWGDRPTLETEKYLEILLYNLVGGVTGFLSDQEKHRRQQLEKTAAGLEESYRTLQQQSDLIIRMEEQLRSAERLSVLGELAAVLAHEIRNPLGSIRGTAEILKDDYQPGDKKFEFLEILLKESDRLNRVVEDFLRLSRPQPLSMKLCNISEELRSVVLLVQAEARDKGLHMELKTEEPLEISGDRDKLHQAFLNIILNGIQSMAGGDTLTIEAQCVRHPRQEYSEIRIVFRDTGAGTPENLGPKIFDPFFTLKKDGTGLGLAITKKIIEAHKGRIEVDANSPKGAIFTVFLPAEVPPSQIKKE
ncbi:MAG: sensor histidine kinase [Deltaproteobacteria bacterium HGW-Deltaproteobacteria-6]|jgi:signal transduction histidine kinase|nr:MAG: sensor histidine kinase [Deltaproteobacteria bacterium HGW-Deltaproteobacteria-6]